MAEKPRRNVRARAAEILTQVDTQKAYADILLDRALKNDAMDERDRALLTEIVYGTLRWRGKIDAELAKYLNRALFRTDARVRNVLRLTCYQLLFLRRVPDYAAVSEAVEIAKLYGGQKTASFVNGVLRNLLRSKPPDPIRSENQSSFSLAAEYSHPEWLVKMWTAQFGLESAASLMRANNDKPPLVVRANSLKCSREQLLVFLREAGITAKPTCQSPQGVSIQSAGTVENLPGFTEGLFQVQGESSQLIAALLSAMPGERILDACAAPGGKTTHIAETMKDRGEIIAIDKSAAGISKLRENLTRLGINSVRAYRADVSRQLDDDFSGPYDRILVDAPCSGFGTLRSHPEIKWHRNLGDVRRLSALQSKILDCVAPHLRRGGILVYATCTLTLEENERNVESFLVRHPEFELQNAASYLPSEAQSMSRGHFFEALPNRHDTDGFFAARMKRAG
ncbi:MAG TPA: 16S rRNA (cytosine(967)-C(5))-methyltransferase RsmB [Candidatus Binatia bacterium]